MGKACREIRRSAFLRWTIISCILTVCVIQSINLFASVLVINRKHGTDVVAAPDTRQMHTAASDNFPSFECAIDPFGRVPNWGAMHSAAQLSRAYDSIAPQEYVATPVYDIRALQIPLSTLNQNPRNADAASLITQKLLYSTRFMGSFDLDGGEWTGIHPGIDYKMPHGTPVRAIAGGVVYAVSNQPDGLGKYVMIEHRMPVTGGRIFSIYGHMDVITADVGEKVQPGDDIGTVGRTGAVTLPHLHLQIDRDDGSEPHMPYVPLPTASRSEVMRHIINPIDVIANY